MKWSFGPSCLLGWNTRLKASGLWTVHEPKYCILLDKIHCELLWFQLQILVSSIRIFYRIARGIICYRTKRYDVINGFYGPFLFNLQWIKLCKAPVDPMNPTTNEPLVTLTAGWSPLWRGGGVGGVGCGSRTKGVLKQCKRLNESNESRWSMIDGTWWFSIPVALPRYFVWRK